MLMYSALGVTVTYFFAYNLYIIYSVCKRTLTIRLLKAESLAFIDTEVEFVY
jgi:hypothetical protein